MIDKPISPLRQRLIEDMTVRRFQAASQKDYIRHVKNFADFLGRSPDTASNEDLRRYQLHMTRTQLSAATINCAIVALRFFFTVTLGRPDLVTRLAFVHQPRKAPVVLSQEEVARLLEAASGVKYKAALSVAYGAGLRASEVVALKVSDIDSQRMMLRVEQGKGRKDRYVMLSPRLLELLRDWWRAARPRSWLFPGREPRQSDDDAPAQSRLPRRRPHGRDHQARVAAYAAAQLRHPSARAGHRHPRDPDSARNRDILPTNTRSRDGSTIRFILGVERRCSLPSNTLTVVLS